MSSSSSSPPRGDDLAWFFSGEPNPAASTSVGHQNRSSPPLPGTASYNGGYPAPQQQTHRPPPQQQHRRPFTLPPPPPPFPSTFAVMMEGENVPEIPNRDRYDVLAHENRDILVLADDLIAALYRSAELILPDHITERRQRSPPVDHVLTDFFNHYSPNTSTLPTGMSVGAVPTAEDIRQVHQLCEDLRRQHPSGGGGSVVVRIVDEPIIRLVTSVTGGSKWYNEFDTRTTNSYGPLFAQSTAQVDGPGDAIVDVGLVVGCFIVPGFEPPLEPSNTYSARLASLNPTFGKVTLWLPRGEVAPERPGAPSHPFPVSVLDILIRPTIKMRAQRCKHCRAVVCENESSLHLAVKHPELNRVAPQRQQQQPQHQQQRLQPPTSRNPLPPPLTSFQPPGASHSHDGTRSTISNSQLPYQPATEYTSRPAAVNLQFGQPPATAASTTSRSSTLASSSMPASPHTAVSNSSMGGASRSSPSDVINATPIIVASSSTLDWLPSVPIAALMAPGSARDVPPTAMTAVKILESSPLQRAHPHIKGVPRTPPRSSDSFETFQPDHVLGLVASFQFVNKIGEGGQGVVWTAKGRGEVLYAVKFTTHDEFDMDNYNMCKLHQEKLHHEHLIPYLCISRIRWTPSSTLAEPNPPPQFGTMVVMPFYSNGDLAHRISKDFKDSLTSVVQWSLQLARVLRYLHGQRIDWMSEGGGGGGGGYRTSVNAHPVAHGDIKLENVLLCEDASQCVLMDLDNCQLLDPSTLAQSVSSRYHSHRSGIFSTSSSFIKGLAPKGSGGGGGVSAATSETSAPRSEVRGTYEWMAPELAVAASSSPVSNSDSNGAPLPLQEPIPQLNPASDVWAFGQLLYVILSRSGDVMVPHPVTGETMSLNAQEWASFPSNWHFGNYGQIINRLESSWGDLLRPATNSPLVNPLTQMVVDALTSRPSLLAPAGSSRGGGLFSTFSGNSKPPSLTFTQSRLVSLIVHMMCHTPGKRPKVTVVEEQISAVLEELILAGL